MYLLTYYFYSLLLLFFHVLPTVRIAKSRFFYFRNTITLQSVIIIVIYSKFSQ